MPTCVIYLKSIYKKKSNRLNTELFVYSGYFNGHFSAENFSSSKQKNIKKRKFIQGDNDFKVKPENI